MGRRFIGYDTDPGYVELARRRVAAVERCEPAPAAAAAAGQTADRLAVEMLAQAGFSVDGVRRRVPRTGVTIDVVACDANGAVWYFDVAGPFTTHQGGMGRSETVWRSLGKAAAVRSRVPETPLVVLTTTLPEAGSDGDLGLRAAGPGTVFDVVDLLSDDARERLGAYAAGDRRDRPRPGFWAPEDLDHP
jgi:site-specific DNA-methyltransferase (adenine-specific)